MSVINDKLAGETRRVGWNFNSPGFIELIQKNCNPTYESVHQLSEEQKDEIFHLLVALPTKKTDDEIEKPKPKPEEKSTSSKLSPLAKLGNKPRVEILTYSPTCVGLDSKFQVLEFSELRVITQGKDRVEIFRTQDAKPVPEDPFELVEGEYKRDDLWLPEVDDAVILRELTGWVAARFMGWSRAEFTNKGSLPVTPIMGCFVKRGEEIIAVQCPVELKDVRPYDKNKIGEDLEVLAEMMASMTTPEEIIAIKEMGVTSEEIKTAFRNLLEPKEKARYEDLAYKAADLMKQKKESKV